MDERLSLGERLAMRMHLAICKNCSRFTQQLQEMRRLFRQETTVSEDAPGLTPAARQRIASELQDRLDD
jgi:hypothetical protein